MVSGEAFALVSIGISETSCCSCAECLEGFSLLLKSFKSSLTSSVISQPRTPLLQSLIGLFELPEDDTIPDEEHFIDIEDTPGYQTAFSQLAFAGKKEHDPVGQMVNNPKIHLAQSLHKLSTACPGRVSVVVARDLRSVFPLTDLPGKARRQ